MPHLRERTLEMVDDALTRILAFGDIIDYAEFTLTLFPGPQGMVPVGMLSIALKGPVLGSTIANNDLWTDLSLLNSQEFVDDRVRVCLGTIRSQRSEMLAAGNGVHPPT